MWIKRLLDVLCSLLGLVLLAPLFVFIGLLIRLDSRGPIFFRQERLGQHGRTFRIWKFRTMIVGAAKIGHGLNVVENDPRITRVGLALRRFSLDELPQFVNILRGDMSLVGPRPALPLHLEFYDEFQKRRLQMRPGLTGLAQIQGRAALSWPERISLDVQYIERFSLMLDLSILLKTIAVVASRDIYNPQGGGWSPEVIDKGQSQSRGQKETNH
jgi:lipopolysaccharide/colanic/teichoic acid biosynthesis glycosyltransferase